VPIADIDWKVIISSENAKVAFSLFAQIVRYYLYLCARQPQGQRSHEAGLAIIANTVSNIDGLVDQIGFVLAGNDRIAISYRHAPVDTMADRAFMLAIKSLPVEGLRYCLGNTGHG
jgi:hypothetical protein